MILFHSFTYVFMCTYVHRFDCAIVSGDLNLHIFCEMLNKTQLHVVENDEDSKRGISDDEDDWVTLSVTLMGVMSNDDVDDLPQDAPVSVIKDPHADLPSSALSSDVDVLMINNSPSVNPSLNINEENKGPDKVEFCEERREKDVAYVIVPTLYRYVLLVVFVFGSLVAFGQFAHVFSSSKEHALTSSHQSSSMDLLENAPTVIVVREVESDDIFRKNQINSREISGTRPKNINSLNKQGFRILPSKSRDPNMKLPNNEIFTKTSNFEIIGNTTDFTKVRGFLLVLKKDLLLMKNQVASISEELRRAFENLIFSLNSIINDLYSTKPAEVLVSIQVKLEKFYEMSRFVFDSAKAAGLDIFQSLVFYHASWKEMILDEIDAGSIPLRTFEDVQECWDEFLDQSKSFSDFLVSNAKSIFLDIKQDYSTVRRGVSSNYKTSVFAAHSVGAELRNMFSPTLEQFKIEIKSIGKSLLKELKSLK